MITSESHGVTRAALADQTLFSRRRLLTTGGAATAATLAAAAAPHRQAYAAEPEIDTSFADFSIPKNGCDTSLVKLQERGEIILGTGNDWPYSFLAPDTNEFSGIDAEIIKFACKMLKIPKITVVSDAFSGMIPGLLDGRFDMIGEVVHWTPKRAEVVSFSYPAYYFGDAVAVKKNGPLSQIRSIDDLKGHKVGAELGTNYAEWLQKIPEIEFVGNKDTFQMMRDLSIGRVDAVLWDSVSLGFVIEDHKDWELEVANNYQTGLPKIPVTYGVYAFRQSDVQLQEAFSAATQWMQNSGDMAKIIAKAGLPASAN